MVGVCVSTGPGLRVWCPTFSRRKSRFLGERNRFACAFAGPPRVPRPSARCGPPATSTRFTCASRRRFAAAGTQECTETPSGLTSWVRLAGAAFLPGWGLANPGSHGNAIR